MCSNAAAPKAVINSLSPTRSNRPAGDDRSFPKTAKLRGRSNFLAVMAGKDSVRHRGRWCEMVTLKRPDGTAGTQFGLTVGRKAGDATRRNRIKRIIREFLRTHKNLWPEMTLVVIRIKAPVTDEADLVAELEDILKNL